jgi:hypothetical protein
MDELEIRIVLRYKVPERGLTFNGLLRGLEQDRDVMTRGLIQAVLAAIEEKAIEGWHQRAPDRYLRNGVNVKDFSYLCGKDIYHGHGKDISQPRGKWISHPPSE